ncbi:MAG: NPCBM/NEW2 domain-containing protein [Planctomycetota bacterium]
MRLLTTMLTALAWLPIAPTAHAAHHPAVRVESVVLEWRDGTLQRSPLGELALTEFGGDGPALARFAGLEQKAATLEPEELCRVTLVGGDHLAGRVAGGEGETLVLRLAGVRLPLGIERLSALEWPARIPTAEAGAIQPPEERDRIYRVAGSALDVVDGTVVAFDDTGIVFEGLLGQKTFAWEEIAALFIEVLDEPDAEPRDGTRVVADLAGGSRLRGRFLSLRSSGLELELGPELRIVLPIEEVLEVAIDDDTLRFLSASTPSAEPLRGSPFDDGGMTWPHRVDRSCIGQPLVVGGHVYHRGLGVHAPSELVYELDGAPWQLRGEVGVDDSVLRGPRIAHGSVRFSIRGDDEELWKSDVMRGGDPAVAFGPLDLDGVSELRLVVDPVDDFMGDRANWLRLLLVR